MSGRRIRRGVLGLALTVAVGAGVSACSLPDLSMSTASTASTASTQQTGSAAAVSAAAATTAIARPSGDLDTGSVTHTLTAGDRTVVLDYWTTQDATTWTADSAKVVQVSATVQGGDADATVTVTRFLATVDDGTDRTTVSDDAGEFALTPPYSYTTALDLPASSAAATELTVTVQLELLVETYPASGVFYRQTVLDTITLPLLQEDPS